MTGQTLARPSSPRGKVVTGAMATRRTFRLLGDQPSVAGEDPLGFDRTAGDLSALIVSSAASTPFTLGIEGTWGSGKSSLMRRLERELMGQANVSTVWFNAWAAREGGVLEGLIKSVLDQIDPSALRRAMRTKRVGAGLRLAGRLAAGVLRVDRVVDEIWSTLSVDPRARNEMGALMCEAMTSWMARSGAASGDRLLVVFVDDLDRCSPENVFQVFEAMKLYLDAPGFVFVVGYDVNVISDAILHAKKYGEAVKSGDYLEKIVQIVHRVPQPDDDEAQRLIDAYAGESLTAEYFDEAARSLLIERNKRNPRRIKRFINGFILEYSLDPGWADVGAESLMRVLLLHTYFPDFARMLTESGPPDPLTEFAEYREVRSLMRRLRVDVDYPELTARHRDLVARVFGDHGLPVPARYGIEVLVPLEDELPELYPGLVQDRDFVEIVQGFGDGDLRRRVSDKLSRRQSRPATLDTESEAEPTSAGEPLPVPIRILWINDDPGASPELVESLIVRGADVVRTASVDEANRILESKPRVQLIVSDVTRHGDDEAGFDISRICRRQVWPFL